MTWVKRHVDEHVCPKPRLSEVRDAHQGDIWECDECHRRWEVHSDQREGLYWLSKKPDGERWAHPGV